MKLSINKSAKRVLSIAIAFAMFLGTMFVANVGVVIDADALDVSNLTISYWNKDFEVQTNGFDVTSTSYLNDTGASGTVATDPIIIDDAKELATLVKHGNYKSTAGYFFKLSDELDAIILQPENVLDAAELMSLSSGEETKAFFDNHANKAQFADWGALCDAGTFAGNFDGNGVEIYGLWMDPTANSGYGRQHGGLFGATDPGIIGSVQYTYTYNESGVYYQNIVIKNSYYFGYRRMGAIIPSTNGPNYGCSASGVYNITNCVVANCYMECTGYNGTNEYNVGSNGILMGGSDPGDTPAVNNCLVYGNVAENKVTTYNEGSSQMAGPFSLIGQCNDYANSDNSVTISPTIKNTISIGSPACVFNYRTTAGHCTNVYCTANYYSTPDVVSMYDAETLKGATAMAWAPALNWGTDWFAVEGQYPTPIEPDRYIPVSEKPTSLFESGDGSKESPYIIRTTDQLYQMVNEQSYTGTYTETFYDYSTSADKSITSYYSKYYKVADGVKALYINDVETQAEVKALAESGACNKWAPTQSVFAGNFDGNGVTIYGMVSTTGKGFVNKVDGTHAAIKNVHFKAAYVKGSGARAAVVTTDFGNYGIGYKATEDATGTTYYNREYDPNGEEVNDWLVANVAVTESYIETTLTEGDNNVATAGGIVTIAGTPQWLTVKNCLFDGVSSTLIDGTGTTAGANADSMKAGIASITTAGTTNRWEFVNCVSINEYPVSMKTGATYTRLTENSGGGSCEISTMYGPANSAIDLTAYPKFGAIIDTNGSYTPNDIPLLDWASTWEMVEVSDDREIPMPTGIAGDTNVVSFSQMIASYKNNTGASAGNGVKGNYGKYGWQYNLAGSGTESDPYLITNALELAQTIGCGGKQYQQPLYYELTCNIDLSGHTWIDQASINDNYHYVPFEGILDGAGHVITGLSAIDTSAAGLVPVLNGGTIKNIHIRNSYAGSNNIAGLIAGQVNSGTIVDCSVENCITAGDTNVITGSDATTNNCYYIVDGEQTFSADVDTSKLYPAADAQWYKGADGIYRQISFAKAGSIIDVDADGIINTTYTVNDVITLRKNLLDETGYLNIYGDVNNDGATNISDLVTIRRDMVGSRDDIRDGFWRSLELGKVSIYYAENDTYDMARKIEVYFEAINPTTDITKVAGTAVTDTSIETKADYANQQNAVVITQGTPTDDTYDDYSITYDATNNVLTFYGGSFTAVEQAVVEFIENADPRSENAEVYTTNGTKSILSSDTNKAYKTVYLNDGSTVKVYYAWGDEFEDTGHYDTDTWEIRTYKDEGTELDGVLATDSAAGDTRYLNLEGQDTENIKDLWEVKNGKLKVWRGINVDVYGDWDNSGWQNVNGEETGYKGIHAGEVGTTNGFGSVIDSDDIYVDPGLIQTSKTMLFKQGYAEMRASLPNDGHAFPAWWFMTGVGNKNTDTHEKHYLFSKVYKLNNAVNNSNADTRWDGVTMTMDPTNLSTYKYQMPQAFLEYDIVEFMQAQSSYKSSYVAGILETGRTAISTGDYRDFTQLTIHKYYNQHVKDSMIYLPDWSTGGYVSGYNGMTQTEFVNTAGSGNNGSDFIHRYNPSNTTAPYQGTLTYENWYGDTESTVTASYSVSKAAESNTLKGSRPSDVFTYGFYWTVDEANGTYELYVYVDFDEDGNMEQNEIVFHIDETNGHETSKLTDPTYDVLKNDASVWNQYAYMLIDNAFYTSNPAGKFSGSTGNFTESGVTMFTDLLSQDNTWETTTFDIEYVRVYQEDGRRDLITPETEAFNTGNHFGY